MANYATLKAAIAAAIKQNGNNEITGNLLQQQLLAMVNSLGAGYQYAGIATPAMNPGTPDQNVFYIASTAGTYANFDGLVLDDGEIAILKYNGAWSKDSTGAASLEAIRTTNKEIQFSFLSEPGKIIAQDGTTTTTIGNNAYCFTKFLYAIPGLVFNNAYAFPASGLKYAWFYNANYDVVGFLSAESEAAFGIPVTLSQNDIPASAKFVRFNVLTTLLYNVANVSNDDLGTEKKRAQDAENSLSQRITTVENGKVNTDANMIQNGAVIADFSQSIWGWEPGLCQSSNGSISHGVWDDYFKYNTVLIPILPNTNYKLGHREPAEVEYFYDINGNYIGYLKPARLEDNTIEFTTPENAYFIRYSCISFGYVIKLLYDGTFTTEQIIDNSREIQALKDEISEIVPPELDLLDVPTIYGRPLTKNEAYIKFNNSLYAEGFVKNANDRLKIDGGREMRIAPNAAGQNDVIVVVSSETARKNVTIHCENVSPNSVSGKAFVLCIGESTTAAVDPDPYKGDVESWGWPSALRQFSLCDNFDNVGVDVVTLGTRGNQNGRTVSYRDNLLPLRSFNEGISGWPSYCFLNWPCFAKFSLNDAGANGFSAKNMWYALGLASKTPYNQAQYNPNREEFVFSSAQLELITNTPFGKYKIDGTETLWNLMQYLSGRQQNGGAYPIFPDLSSQYDGSASQINMMQEWADELANEPMNRFYNINEARTGSSGTAFDLNKYLERYRTMDNAGNRLEGSAGQTVIGGDGQTYTIGTKVNNTNDYDVCTPTHVIINVGVNDSEANSVTIAVASLKRLISLFTVPTAYFLTRMPGVCNLGDWGDLAIPAQYVPFAHNVGVLSELKGWFDEQVNKYLLPIYAIQYPCSVTEEFVEESITHEKRVNTKTPNIHPGVFAYRSVGFQCLCWLYYVKSL